MMLIIDELKVFILVIKNRRFLRFDNEFGVRVGLTRGIGITLGVVAVTELLFQLFHVVGVDIKVATRPYEHAGLHTDHVGDQVGQ